jgi:uncharacterized protein (DUF952 family)
VIRTAQFDAVYGASIVTYYPDSSDARSAGITYHLVPVDIWQKARNLPFYTPEAYEADGFIHCTNGIDQVIEVGNRYYTGDPRQFVLLVLDVPRITSEIRYDDPDRIFPHIYGPLNTDAVVGELTVNRAPDGTFLSVDRPA